MIMEPLLDNADDHAGAGAGDGAQRLNELHETLFSKRWWERAFPFVLVLLPLVVSTLRLALSPQTVVIESCSFGFGSGFLGGGERRNVSECVAFNGQKATIDVPGFFFLNSTSILVYLIFTTLAFFYGFADLMYTFDVTTQMATRLLPYRIAVTSTRKHMVKVLVGAVASVLMIAFFEMLFLSLAVTVELDKGLDDCRGQSETDPHACHYAANSDDFFGTFAAGNYFSRTVPLLLQFSGFFAFLFARFNDLYGSLSVKALLLPPPGSAARKGLRQLSLVDSVVAYGDLKKAVTYWWVERQLKKGGPTCGLRPGGPHAPLAVMLYTRVRMSPGYLTVRRRYLAACTDEEVEEIVDLLRRHQALKPIEDGNGMVVQKF